MVFALFQVLSCVRPSRQFSDSIAVAQASFVAQLVKNLSACSAGDLALIPGLGRSTQEGKGYPLQYSGLEKNSIELYRPWGHKELDTTERLSHT